MTFKELCLYYWLLAIMFETIYVYVTFKATWNKIKKKAQQHEIIMEVIKAFKQQASFQLLYKQIFNPITYIWMYVLFCIISPILFPVTFLRLIRKAIYKTDLEKKAELEVKKSEEAMIAHEEWIKNEGEIMPDDEPTKLQ